VLLLTNNPGKLEALSEGGVDVTARIPLHTAINPENRRYLATKAARGGHWLEDMLEVGEPGRDPIGSPS
jgi:GTP cyclohydrolase II